MRVGGIRIEFDGFSRAASGFHQIPIETHIKMSMRGIDFSGSRIEFDGFRDGFSDLRESVLRTAKIENHFQNINVGESGIRLRVVRVEPDGFGVKSVRLLIIFRRTLMKMKTRFEKSLISGERFCAARR